MTPMRSRHSDRHKRSSRSTSTIIPNPARLACATLTVAIAAASEVVHMRSDLRGARYSMACCASIMARQVGALRPLWSGKMMADTLSRAGCEAHNLGMAMEKANYPGFIQTALPAPRIFKPPGSPAYASQYRSGCHASQVIGLLVSTVCTTSPVSA